MNTILNRSMIKILPFLILLASCTSGGLKTEPIALNENPTKQLELMKTELEEARSKDVHTLSPNWFEKANKSYEVAKALHKKGGNLKDIFENLSLSHAQLRRAQKLAPVAKVVLVPVIAERNKALKAGANESTKGFAEAQEEYLKLTALVENDRREKAEKESAKVKSMFSGVELEAITDHALNPSRNRLNEAIKLGAKTLAPKTLALSEQQLSVATQFIAANRYDKEGIEKQANLALFMADRAVTITKETLDIKKDSPETVALRFESMGESIASNLDLPDIRNLDFARQTEEINKSIRYVKDVRDKMQSKSVDLESEIKKLTGVHESQVSRLENEKTQKLEQLKSELEKEESLITRLKKEKEFEDLLKSVHNEFSPKEAEVYRQGNKLVFRLRGADFPVGKATIPTKNYPLLAKLTKSLKQFDSAKIIVEGHTDSKGLAETNDKLSELRAKAVSDYLVAHGAAPREKIETIGFGYRHPIATNKTPDGRQKNRRIDVIAELNNK